MDAWLVQTARVVSLEDVGRDELSVEQLIKKHDDTVDELTQFRGQIDQLGAQADQLPPEVSDLTAMTISYNNNVLYLGPKGTRNKR